MAEPSVKDLAYRTAASVFGGPVDLATMVMRPFGYKTPDEKVFGSSEYIGKKLEDVGLVSSARAPITEFLTSMAVPTPGGLAKGAALTAPQVLSMFVGARSLTWDASAAEKAKMLADIGTDARTIWQQTGTWKGPDGKWRQEISDDAARMNLGALPRFAGTDAQSGKVANVLRNKPLDAAYPDLGMVDLSANPARMTSASYMEGGGLIPENIALNRPTRFSLRDEIPGQKEVTKESLTDRWFLQNFGGDQAKLDAWTNQQLTELARKEDYLKRGYAPDRGAKSDLLHELQHAIQQREGFARGGSPSDMRQEALEMLRRDVASGAIGDTAEAMSMLPMAQQNAYRRLAGEAEARATQARMNMTPAERRAAFPEESYDVPINQLIVR